MFVLEQWLLPVLLLISAAHGARVLIISPFESHSQCLLITPYIRALAERGHQLTVIHAFEHCNPVGNVTYIRVLDNIKVCSEFAEMTILPRSISKWEECTSLTRLMINAAVNVLNNFEVRNLVQSNTTFDLVVVEPAYTDLLFGLATHFNAQLIGLSTCGADWNLGSLLGHGSSLALDPLMPWGETSVASFWDRLYNWFNSTEEWLLMQLVFLPKLKLVHDHFFGHLKQSFSEIRHSFSLFLLNQHFSLFRARSSVPGMVEVAGMHIPKEVPKLPKDLQQFIDEAEHGVIYFALGLEMQGKLLVEERQRMLLETFRLLPQRVIWKFNGEPPCEVADNIYLTELPPQQAILAHPNVRLFISHGGMLSIIEAAFYGKPVLGMPLFYDQFRNLAVLLEEGAALQVNMNSVTSKDLKNSVDRLISEPSFKENSLAVSERFRDQLNHPLDVAVYWTEYVLRHRGAHHLKVSPSHIKLIEYYSVDKFLMVGMRLTLVVAIVFLVLFKWKCLFSYFVRMSERFWPIYALIGFFVKIWNYIGLKFNF